MTATDPQRDVVVQLAVTLDGYIARSDGTFDYLDRYPCDVVDTLDLVIVPEALGSGLPLFTEPVVPQMNLIEATTFPCGSVRLVWKLKARNGPSAR